MAFMWEEPLQNSSTLKMKGKYELAILPGVLLQNRRRDWGAAGSLKCFAISLPAAHSPLLYFFAFLIRRGAETVYWFVLYCPRYLVTVFGEQ